MQFAYHNNGLMPQTGGGDKRSLGSLGGTSLEGPTLLPAPGAPEIMAMGGCGCGCKGAGTCGKGLGDIASVVSGMSTTELALTAGAAYLAWRMFFKKKRR